MAEPGWKMVGIYADKGITGTSVDSRDEFKRMIRQCKRGKIDLILTKSVSRFARNTLDTLAYTRSLREIGVDVYFEEQNIHSIDPSSDFMISLYGSLAQSESESISENVKWGKRQSAKEGKVPFPCSTFLGYRKTEDGQIEIVPEEAEIVRRVYKLYLDGKSLREIADILNNEGVPRKSGAKSWYPQMLRGMLENVKYKGDVLTNKTYRTSVTSKKIRKNEGEMERFYISKHHPAIIDDVTFARVQAELEKRRNVEKSYQKGRKTEKGLYRGKFVFNSILVCGECGMPYRRCVWTSNGEKRVVWRCVKRLEYGKKYCHNSPTIYEEALKLAVMRAISEEGSHDSDVKKTLKESIKIGLEDADLAATIRNLQFQLEGLTQQFDIMLDSLGDTSFDENAFQSISEKKYEIETELSKLKQKEISEHQQRKLQAMSELIDFCNKAPLAYDDSIVRRTIKKIRVVDKETVEITFIDGYTTKQRIVSARSFKTFVSE